MYCNVAMRNAAHGLNRDLPPPGAPQLSCFDWQIQQSKHMSDQAQLNIVVAKSKSRPSANNKSVDDYGYMRLSGTLHGT